jgi:hypothetical protein
VPHCGILNPVVQWVALPDGAHLTQREPVSGRVAADPFAFFATSPSNANAAALAAASYKAQARAASREGISGNFVAIADHEDAIETGMSYRAPMATMSLHRQGAPALAG